MREGGKEGWREGRREGEGDREVWCGAREMPDAPSPVRLAARHEHAVHARRSVTWDCWQYGVMWNQHTVREIGERADNVHAEVLRLFQAAGRMLPARSAIRWA